jgi:hypothetical protein
MCDLQKLKHVLNKVVERGIDQENALLLKHIGDIELELKRVKAKIKKMELKHCEELRIRDRKELLMFAVVASCCLIYVCVALLTRGFI